MINISNIKFFQMAGDMLRVTVAVVCALVVLLSLVQFSEANYKNAPMNGIMFGKRGPSGEWCCHHHDQPYSRAVVA